ncbi:MAG: CGGC domain-containing protein [Desulfuromonas sp.]|nr:MAG: CGGC domain-containing protein [Desulfuromonas sp.]
MEFKDYLVVVQCHIVKQRCSGYLCERAFHERSGGFQIHPKESSIRFLSLTCGGCCGRALHRKLGNLVRMANNKEGITRERILVRFSSCITKDNYHGPPCPHLDYLKELVRKLELACAEDTVISAKSERLRATGVYKRC